MNNDPDDENEDIVRYVRAVYAKQRGITEAGIPVTDLQNSRN